MLYTGEGFSYTYTIVFKRKIMVKTTVQYVINFRGDYIMIDQVSEISIEQSEVIKWLEVLADPQSKKEKQHLENYKDSNKRCCLGHLCHALNLKMTKDAEYLETRYHDDENADSSFLPLSVAKQLDITVEGRFVRGFTIEKKDSILFV